MYRLNIPVIIIFCNTEDYGICRKRLQNYKLTNIK